MSPSTRSLVAALGWNSVALANLAILAEHIATGSWGWAAFALAGLAGSIFATVTNLNQWLARKVAHGVHVYIHQEDTHAEH